MPKILIFVLLCGVMWSCGSETESSPASAEGEAMSADTAAEPALRLLVLGDSLTAGYGVSEDEAYPHLLEHALQERGLAVRVLNAGVSGDTLADGYERLDWVLQQEVDWVFLALGANDGLRGHDLQAARATLESIITEIQRRDLPLMLAGMALPSNYGASYRQRFERMFVDVAEEYHLPFLPFLLQGVAMQPEYNLADGVHPNAQGHARIARTVADALEPYLREAASQAPASSAEADHE
ncbi:MAG: arylesterase [Planctomycetota bacterium]|nr:MAG: arylesterase [Planctomycetota bacterium]